MTHHKQWPKQYGASYEESTWLLTEVWDCHWKLWSWVRRTFPTIAPVSSIVIWSMIFIGATSPPGNSLIRDKGMGKQNPCVTSCLMSFWSRLVFVVAPLWFPNTRTASTSWSRLLPGRWLSGHSDPHSSIVFNLYHSGCHWKMYLSINVGQNSYSWPRGGFSLPVVLSPNCSCIVVWLWSFSVPPPVNSWR